MTLRQRDEQAAAFAGGGGYVTVTARPTAAGDCTTVEHNQAHVLVTTSEGVLVGVLQREAVEQAINVESGTQLQPA